jgi:hypothetical protein
MDSILIDSTIKKIFVIILAIVFFSDAILIYYIDKHKCIMSNYYYSLHIKFGSLKLTFIKLAGALFLVDGLIIEPSGKSGSIFTIITAYCIAVTKLFIDYRKAKIEQ